MTPEERQLLTTLADRVKSTPPQQKDLEADQLLQQLVRERPDTAYILAQTVLMQDFALRNAQAQIDDLRRQLSQPSASVPRVNPWGGPPQGRPYDDAPPPPPPAAGYPGSYGGPVMQPSQTGGFLRSAAQTAAGVAGGALLFQGINSLFSGHSGLMGGSGGLGALTHRDSLSETTVANNHSGDDPGQAGHDSQAVYDDHSAGSGGDSLIDADYDDSGYDEDDSGSGGGDFA
jgi:hypothetical protein